MNRIEGEKYAIREIFLGDKEYPALLTTIPDAPKKLFVAGTLHSPIIHPIAIVGARAITHYGAQVIEKLVPVLGQAGCTIISGLALGCDGKAHEMALASRAYTIAVLGSGIDEASLYPHEHLSLAHRILENGGALISEYSPGTPALKHHFIARNRIIAGLAQGTLVVEAAARSGSLITARFSLEYNRNVYAIPGSLFSRQSEGTNALIAQGAKVVTVAEHVLEDFGIIIAESKPQEKYMPENETERIILAHLTHEPIHFDALMSVTLLPLAELMVCLTMLETKHTVKKLDGNRYIKY